MVAVELEPTDPTSTPSAQPALTVVAGAVDSGASPQAQVRDAERRLGRAAVTGMLIGMPLCAVLWVGIVALALTSGDADWDVLPALGMAVVVGMFAGAFFGGWAGVTLTAHALDEAELEASRH
jgi:Mg/Co/Ni transporter MgtE